MNKTLKATIIGCLMVSSQSAGAALVGHWNFDEGAGTTAADASGNGRVGSLQAASGGNAPSWTAGVNGGALHFDGSGYVDMANTASAYNFGAGGFSVAAWVRYGTLNDAEYLIAGKHDAGYTNGFFLSVGRNAAGNANKLDFYFNHDSTRIVTPSSYDDNQWHFVVGTNDGTTGSLYVDNQFIGSFGGTPASNSVDFLVGGVFFQGNFVGGFTGDIDDVRVYDTALSQGEIVQIYNSTIPEPNPLLLLGLGFPLALCSGRVRKAVS